LNRLAAAKRPLLLSTLILVAAIVAGCSQEQLLQTTADSGRTTMVTVDMPAAGGEFSVTTPTSGGPEPAPGPFVIHGRNLRYEEGVGLVVDISLRNAGDHTHLTPVSLTFVDLLPPEVTILNADNGESGPGAAFTMELDPADGEWNPGEETLASPVQFGVERGVSVGFVARIDIGMEPGLGSIGGVVWNDLDRNGELDPGEAGLPGVAIGLTGDGHEPRRAVTDPRGTYRFDGLDSGLWVVTKGPRDDTEPTTPTEVHVLLVEEDGDVGDFLMANFGCIAARDDSTALRVGDWVEVTGEFMREPDRIEAQEVEVEGGDVDAAVDSAELRGPVTGIADDQNALAIMGTRVSFGDGPVEIDPPNQCGEKLEDLEEGSRVRVRVGSPPDGEKPLPGTSLRCWNGSPEKISGAVEKILQDDGGRLRGFVVLRTTVLVSERTEWKLD
jgi:hypothetical protein